VDATDGQAVPAARLLPRAHCPRAASTCSTATAHAVVRCGGVGQNGTGGHAHNDVASFELSLAGVPARGRLRHLRYTADPHARNAFRSTRAHNTVGRATG
jgi:hypothetical protein